MQGFSKVKMHITIFHLLFISHAKEIFLCYNSWTLLTYSHYLIHKFLLPCWRLYIHSEIYLGKQKHCALNFLVEKMLHFVKKPETVPINLGATVCCEARIHMSPCDQDLLSAPTYGPFQ